MRPLTRRTFVKGVLLCSANADLAGDFKSPHANFPTGMGAHGELRNGRRHSFILSALDESHDKRKLRTRSYSSRIGLTPYLRSRRRTVK